MSHGRSTLVAVIAVVVAALAAVAGCGAAPEPFPHRAHLDARGCGGPGQQRCPTCLGCHEGADRKGTNLRPTRSVCARCHESSNDAAKLTPTRPGVAEHSKVTFEHARHLPMPTIAGQCVRCHKGVVDDGKEGGVYPPMETCVEGCHAEDMTRGECRGCHGALDLRKLVPRTYLRHDGPFLRDHGLEATQNAAVCNHCHGQSDCNDCHDATQDMSRAWRGIKPLQRELPHPIGWFDRHPMEARSSPTSCLKCHQVSTCEGCHLSRGVSAANKEGINPHPRGWVGPNRESRDFHGRAARLDILSCAACHDQGPATNCIRCHKVGGVGKNPHPGGWKSARSPKDAMCRYCHAP